MTELARDIVHLLSNVEILSPTRVRLGDEEVLIPTALASTPSPAGAVSEVSTEDSVARDLPNTAIGVIEQMLYARFYTRAKPANVNVDAPSSRDFIDQLSRANTGHGTFEPGWRVQGLDEDGRIAVEKTGLTLWVPPMFFIPSAGEVRPGVSGRVRVGKELRGLMPGFYFAIGDGNPDESEETNGPLVRLYWNLVSRSAPTAMHAITSALNPAGVPFRFKVLTEPMMYMRADAGVLYIAKQHYRAVQPALARAYFAVRSGLRNEEPLFTKRLAPGLGLAEDPGKDKSSFGQHRCRLLAGAMWRCFENGRQAPEDRRAEVLATFAALKLDPQRPYLSSGSVDDYGPFTRGRDAAKRKGRRRP